MQQMQLNELEQAITRATSWGIEVRGKGHRRSDGVRVWTTTSREDVNRWHTVALVRGSRLVCDCQARKVCCHIGAVYMRLVVQADRYQRLAESIEARYAPTKEAKEAKEARPVGWDAPLLPSRGNAAISIFK